MDQKDLVIGSQANLNSYLQDKVERLERELKIVRNDLRILRRENAKLREENELLKSAFGRKVRENYRSYREMEKYLSKLELPIFRIIESLCVVKRRPVSYEEIMERFRELYPEKKTADSTIRRTVRKLMEDGKVESPIKNSGFFHPIGIEYPNKTGKMEVNKK